VSEESLWSRDGGVYFGFGVDPVEPDKDKSILEAEWRPDPESMQLYPNPAQPRRGDGHLVTIGPNGSGKTRRVLVPNLFRLGDWSAVVIDLKGELAALTAAHRASKPGHRVKVIDPFGVMPKSHPELCERYPFLRDSGFNPLSLLDPESDDFPDDAMALTEAIIRVEGKEPHWSQSAQDLVAALIMFVLSKYKKGSLGIVRTLLGQSTAGFTATIGAMIKAGSEPRREELSTKAARFAALDSDNRELNGIISTALTQTRWLDSRPIRADLDHGRFDFGAMKQTPTTVYLILPPRYLVTHSTWLRVMITSALMPLLRSVDDAKVPVLFMLDEFAQLGRMQVIENNLALMRGYGVKLWLVLQDLAQLKSLYKQRWESFIGNAGVVQSFAPQDVTTRDYLSKLSGQRFYWISTGGTSASESFGPQFSQSKGLSENTQHVSGPKFWPQGLGSMEMGQAVLFSRGKLARTWLPDPEDKDDLLGYRDQMIKASTA